MSNERVPAGTSGFSRGGPGLSIRFLCGDCGRHSQSTGSGIRAVRGLRTKVCEQCKDKIDARKKVAP